MNELKNFENVIDQVRDIFRRSRPPIIGMDSMRHLVIYLVHRYLTREKCNLFNIPERFSWEEMYSLGEAEVLGWEKSRTMITEGEESLMLYIDDFFGTGEFNFIINDWKIHREICVKFNDINIDDIKTEADILGLLYERHLKTGSGPARDLGQYFTDRQITRYMVELCKPKFIDGNLESVIDPTMGTAGFLSSCIKYIDEHYENVNWKDYQHRIHGHDVDQFVGAMAKINLFLETHGINFENLTLRDSLYQDTVEPTFDIILANMPFGIKGLVHSRTCDKVKDLKIRGTKSEPLFLQLMMTSLSLGGRCAVVVPDGVLTNTSSKLFIETRKYLLENFDLRKVIKMEGKFFINTSIKPYILFFRNNGKATKKVNFYEVDRVDDKLFEKKILSVPVENLDNKYVLDIKRFQECTVSIIPDHYEKKFLKELVEMKKGKNIPEKERMKEGPIPYYASNGIKGYVETSNFEGPAIVMAAKGSIGSNSVHWIEDIFHASSDTLVIKNDDSIFLRYLYHYLKLSDIKWFAKSKCIMPAIDMERFNEMEIAIPSEDEMIKINDYFDELYQGEIKQEDTLKLTKHLMTLALQDDSMSQIERIINCQRLLLDIERTIKNLKDQMAGIYDMRYHAERVKLGDILSVSSGDYIPKDQQVKGEYPIYGGGGISGCIDRSNRENEFIISKDAISKECVRYIRNRFFLNHHAWIITIKNEEYDKYYVGYYLMTIQDRIYNLATGTAQKGINKDSFYSLTIPSISLERQKFLVSRLNDIYSQIENMERLRGDTEQNAKIILENYIQ